MRKTKDKKETTKYFGDKEKKKHNLNAMRSTQTKIFIKNLPIKTAAQIIY